MQHKSTQLVIAGILILACLMIPIFSVNAQFNRALKTTPTPAGGASSGVTVADVAAAISALQPDVPALTVATKRLDTSACQNVADPTDAQVPANGIQQQFDHPEIVTDFTHLYCAIFVTEHGRFVIELYPKYAPQNVNNFIFLAQQGFYDGGTFHRVIPNFMAQFGDPTGTGSGGPGYENIPLEATNGLHYDSPGMLGVARTADPDSAGSQFFITFAPYPSLDNQYTIIGKVSTGMDVVKKIRIRNVDSDPNAQNIPPEKITSVRIVDIGPAE
jgi:peptidylprolyl isomerase